MTTINQMRKALIKAELVELKFNKISLDKCASNIDGWYKKSGQQIKEWYDQFFITKEK